jgi:hypothetical protein
MYTKYPNWYSWISKLMIVYWPVFCKILFTGLYYWNLLHLSVIWRIHTYSSHTIDLYPRGTSNDAPKQIIVLSIYLSIYGVDLKRSLTHHSSICDVLQHDKIDTYKLDRKKMFTNTISSHVPSGIGTNYQMNC